MIDQTRLIMIGITSQNVFKINKRLVDRKFLLTFFSVPNSSQTLLLPLKLTSYLNLILNFENEMKNAQRKIYRFVLFSLTERFSINESLFL